MGLLDKAKAETEKYIEVDLFLYYLAFSQNETLDNVVTWLRNNYFENDIISHEIDENYRIEPNLENPNIDNQTALLLDMLQIDGLFNYFMYFAHYQDGLDLEPYCYDGYKPVHTNFYYEINYLNELKYFKELGIDFYNAKKYSFTINSHDEVKAELRLDSRLEKLITFTSETIDTDNPFSPNQEPQEYYILEALRHSQKNEINHDLPNTSELVQQVADLIKPNAKNRNPNKPQPKSHELVGSGTANRQTGSKELLQQIAELQNQLNQVNAENEHLKKALLQKQVNDENLNSFLFYPSDDTQKDLEQLANHYNKNESEVIQDIFNEQLDDIKPMIEYIQYVGKNNIQDENINRLFDLIKESGQSIKFFSALSKAGFVPRASEPSQSSEIADDKPLHTTEQNAVTKLLYALFSEHNYDLNGAKRGATNDQLVNLTNRHKAGVNKDTIAKWLERANTLKNNLQK